MQIVGLIFRIIEQVLHIFIYYFIIYELDPISIRVGDKKN